MNFSYRKPTPIEIAAETANVRAQHPSMDSEEAQARAYARVAFSNRLSPSSAPKKPRYFHLSFFEILVLVLLVLIAARAHAQIQNVQVVDSTNTNIGFWTQRFIIKCNTGLTCTNVGGVLSMVGTGGGSGSPGGLNTQVQYNNGGAFGGITNMTSDGTNVTKLTAGAGPFDFTNATIIKLRIAAGLTTSANGDCGYDTTANRWHCFANGSDRLVIVSTNVGTSGQVPLSNADGSSTFGDPVVSQPTASLLNAQVVGNVASGSSDSGNPVKTGGVFNTTQPTVTNGQRVDQQMTARGETMIAKGVTGFSIDNTGFNVNNSPTVNQGTPTNWAMNTVQWAGSNLGAMANYGTSPGAVLVPGVNAFITNTPNVTIQSNASINEAQVAGTTTSVNNGTVDAGTQRVAVASNNSAIANWGHGATASAVPANATQIAGNGSGNLTPPTVCDNVAPFSFSSTTNQKIITNAASKTTYICAINIVVAAAVNVALVSGTKVTNECDTSTAGLAGGTTAATGWNFAANGGLTQGTGIGWITKTATTAKDVCLFASAAVQVSGFLTYTQY